MRPKAKEQVPKETSGSGARPDKSYPSGLLSASRARSFEERGWKPSHSKNVAILNKEQAVWVVYFFSLVNLMLVPRKRQGVSALTQTYPFLSAGVARPVSQTLCKQNAFGLQQCT